MLPADSVLALAPDDSSAATKARPPASTPWPPGSPRSACLFACTPDVFPGLMAAAIRREDIGAWAAAWGMVASAGRRGRR